MFRLCYCEWQQIFHHRSCYISVCRKGDFGTLYIRCVCLSACVYVLDTVHMPVEVCLCVC